MKIDLNTKRGTVLDNGATLLEIKGAGSLGRPDNGFIVLCLSAYADGAEYVTWYARSSDYASGVHTLCTQGHYALGLADALRDFTDRT